MPGASDVRAGRAFVEMYLKDAAFRRGLKNLRGLLRGVANAAVRLTKAALTMGAAAGVALLKPLKSAAELQQAMHRLRLVFGENAAGVEEWGTAFARSVGRSRKEIYNFLGVTKELLSPLGFSEEAAGEMSKQLTRLAVDLASFNNVADSDVLHDLQSAMTGSAVTLRKYGVMLNAAAINQRAMNQGLDPTKLNEQQKALLRFEQIMELTTFAQGDATRANDRAANSAKAFQASMENAAASLGQLFLPAATEGLQILTAFAVTLADGEIANAADLLWKLLASIWKQGTYSLERFWINMINGALKMFLSFSDGVRRGWMNVVTFIQNIWSRTFQTIAGFIVRIRSLFDDAIDVDAELESLRAGADAAIESRADFLASLDGQIEDQLRVLEQGRKAELEALDRELFDAMENSRKAFEEVLNPPGGEQTPFGEGLPTADSLAGAAAAATSSTESGVSALGTFDARFASQVFGGGNVEREQLDVLRRMLRTETAIKDALEEGGIPVVG